jgi:hypothetical protein
MPGRIAEAIDKGFFVPWPMLRNFIGAFGPLSYIIAKHPGVFKDNFPHYYYRLKKSRLPWAHIINESKFDSTKKLTKKDFENLPPIRNEKYLRPTRLCECDALEIRAIAKKLGAGKLLDKEFAQAAYKFVLEEKKFVAKPMIGALNVFKTRGGVCLDQLSLLAAIARAGGIPARYRLYALTFTEPLYDIFVVPNPIVNETFEMLGFLDSLHGEAELYIDGKWIAGDPTFSPELSAGLDMPITYLGEEPAWRVRVEGKGDIRFEGFPAFFRHLMIPTLLIILKTIDDANKTLDEIRIKGKEILENTTIEEYNKKKNKTFKPKIPTISEIKAFRNKNTV